MTEMQIAELLRMPEPALMSPVKSAPIVSEAKMKILIANLNDKKITSDKFLRRAGYTGNKPGGGLWTSTYTPMGPHASDWLAGLNAKGSLTATFAEARTRQGSRGVYALDVLSTARVLNVLTIDDALEFTERYRIKTVPSLRASSRWLTSEVTDWARVPYDGIRLCEDVVDELYGHWRDGDDIDTAFTTWTCESTLWLRWSFENVRVFDVGGDA